MSLLVIVLVVAGVPASRGGDQLTHRSVVLGLFVRREDVGQDDPDLARTRGHADRGRGLAGEQRGDADVLHGERPLELVDDLEDTDRPVTVLERHRQDRARHEPGRIGDPAPEARIVGRVGQRDALAGREDVARQSLGRRDRQPDDRLALRAGRDDEPEVSGRLVEKRDRGGLGAEDADGRIHDRAEECRLHVHIQPDRRVAAERDLAQQGSGVGRQAAGVVGAHAFHHLARCAMRATSTTTRSLGSTRRRPSETSSATTRFTLWRVPPIIAASSV